MARDYRLIIAFILQWRRHLLLLVDSMAGPRDRDSTAGTRDRLSDVPPRRQDTQVVMMHVEALCRGTDLSRPSKESLAVNELPQSWPPDLDAQPKEEMLLPSLPEP